MKTIKTRRPPDEQPVTLHDILTAWQAGRLGARQAMALAGIDGMADLYKAARHSGVALRKTLLPEERRAADFATAAIRKRLVEPSTDTSA